MTRPLTPGICFIGGASTVPRAIEAAAASGLSVVLVESGGIDRAGSAIAGVLALRAAGMRAEALRHGLPLGKIDAGPDDVDFGKVAARLRAASAVGPDASPERFAALGVRVIRGEACFRDRRTLTAGDLALRAMRFVIATGSVPAAPPIEGLGSVQWLTAESILALAHRPARLLVVGAGPASLELAQAWRRLGSEVTLVSASPLLPDHDPEMAAVVQRQLAADGVAILDKATVSDVQPHGRNGVRLQVMSERGLTTLDGTHLLLADDRTANLAGLGLDKARIAHSDTGITVSAALRTSNRQVYAIGDVAGPRHLAHVADQQAAMVVRGLLSGRDETFDAAFVPRLVFTDPELAEVGMTAADAARHHRRARILRWPYAENARARAEGATAGHVRLVVDRDGRILGASIAGANAVELIGLWAMALSKGMTVGDVAGLALPVATFTDIGMRAAMSGVPVERRRSIVRRLAGLLRA
jgi:pyruvate/2-oxoglutarate dehydrogenase complex dihydrolipoamide dehydrogenase (E3) component